MDKKKGGIFHPSKKAYNYNHLKEDGLLTKKDLRDHDESGIGSFLDERPTHPKIAEFFRAGSHDWNQVK